MPSFELDPRSPIRIADLLTIERWHAQLAWQPFRERIDAFRLYGVEGGGPSAVLLRYAPGGRVPWHEHIGHEHILVLAGSQADESGRASAGSLIVNRPGTAHSVVSEDGCIVLLIYELPVRFVPPP
ncbi:MAG: cupin domain-containing protein [Gammaproteobacteria bacterium]